MLNAYIIKRIQNEKKAKESSKAIPLRIEHPAATHQKAIRNSKKPTNVPSGERGSAEIDFEL